VSTEHQPPKANPIKSILKFVLFLGVGVAILYFVFRNQEAGYQAECDFKIEYDCDGKCEHESLMSKLWSDFGGASVFWLAMVCLMFMISNLSRALRWNLLIQQLDGGDKYRPKWYNSFFSIMIGYLVNLALPRAGEFARPATLGQYEKISVDKLLGTVVTDRILDMLMLLLIVGFTLLFQFQNIYNFLAGNLEDNLDCVKELPTAEEGGGLPILWILGGMAALGLLGLLVAYVFRERLMQTAIYKKLRGMAFNFVEGLKTVFSLRRQALLWFFFHTIVIWLMYFMMTYLCFFAYGPTVHLGPEAALLAFVFGAFGIVVPSPGGMGTYQLTVTAALTIFGIDPSDAFAFSNISFFTINLFCNIGFGLLAYVALPLLNRGRKELS
jgi:uncharacterized membrane protein YbhN (UPF0104 family)